MMTEMAAIIFCLAAAIATGFQVFLFAGKPWGEWTMGGRFQGQLPLAMRMAALMQAVLLLLMVIVVISASGLGLDPIRQVAQKGIWGVCGFFVLGSILNLLTPSVKERKLWAPVNLVLLGTSLMVALSFFDS